MLLENACINMLTGDKYWKGFAWFSLQHLFVYIYVAFHSIKLGLLLWCVASCLSSVNPLPAQATAYRPLPVLMQAALSSEMHHLYGDHHCAQFFIPFFLWVVFFPPPLVLSNHPWFFTSAFCHFSVNLTCICSPTPHLIPILFPFPLFCFFWVYRLATVLNWNLRLGMSLNF